jgi:hypothetical protein
MHRLNLPYPIFLPCWISIALLLGACREYGSIASLATPDVRGPADEFLGSWRAPEALRCRNYNERNGTRFALPFHVFTVDTIMAGDLRMVGVPDPACAAQATDTLEYRGSLVRLGGRTTLEFRLERDEHSMLLPLFQWMRVGARGDTIFLETLFTDSLAKWLARSPGLTPHRLSDSGKDLDGNGTLVLTGDAKQLQDFARKAFANPAVVNSDTLVFVRDRPERHGPPRS